MKPKHLALAIITVLYVGTCTTLTTEQITAYNAAGQGVVHGVLSDYKQVRPLVGK